MPSIAAAPEAFGWLHQHGLLPFLDEVRNERLTELDRIAEHIEMSLTELLQKTDEEIGRAATDVETPRRERRGDWRRPRPVMATCWPAATAAGRNSSSSRSLTLQAVERLTTALVLPHPELAIRPRSAA